MLPAEIETEEPKKKRKHKEEQKQEEKEEAKKLKTPPKVPEELSAYDATHQGKYICWGFKLEERVPPEGTEGTVQVWLACVHEMQTGQPRRA